MEMENKKLYTVACMSGCKRCGISPLYRYAAPQKSLVKNCWVDRFTFSGLKWHATLGRQHLSEPHHPQIDLSPMGWGS
jgi:hypothetical protein